MARPRFSAFSQSIAIRNTRPGTAYRVRRLHYLRIIKSKAIHLMPTSSNGLVTGSQSIIEPMKEVDAEDPGNSPFQYVYLRRAESDFANYACDG